MWLAALPFAMAYLVAAQKAGLSVWEMQFMSLSVYSASAQLVLSQELANGAAGLSIGLSIFLMHLHYILYGLSLARQIKLSPVERGLAAFGLTDFSFALTMACVENTNRSLLFGIELSIFLAWNFNTAAVILFTSLLPNMNQFHLDFIIPLSFFSLLISSIKKPSHVFVAIVAGCLAYITPMLGLGQFSTVLVILISPIFGMLAERILK